MNYKALFITILICIGFVGLVIICAIYSFIFPILLAIGISLLGIGASILSVALIYEAVKRHLEKNEL